MAGGQGGSPRLPRTTLSIATSCRSIPALSRVSLCASQPVLTLRNPIHHWLSATGLPFLSPSRCMASEVQYGPTMQNWSQALADFYSRSSTWIEAFYKAHTGLLGLIGVVGTLASAVYARRAIAKNNSTPPNGASTELNPALHPGLLDWVRSDEKPPTSLDRRNRLLMLKRVRSDWIEGVLKQSLYQVASLPIRLVANHAIG